MLFLHLPLDDSAIRMYFTADHFIHCNKQKRKI